RGGRGSCRATATSAGWRNPVLPRNGNWLSSRFLENLSVFSYGKRAIVWAIRPTGRAARRSTEGLMRSYLMTGALAVLAVSVGTYVTATQAQNAPTPAAKRTAAPRPAEKPTPRTSDGHPDLNGFYTGGGGDRDAPES